MFNVTVADSLIRDGGRIFLAGMGVLVQVQPGYNAEGNDCHASTAMHRQHRV